MKYSWLRQILITIDQLFNVLFYGWADETISARSWRRRDKIYFGKIKLWGIIRVIVDTLFFFEKDHCRLSYESEQQRNHLPPEMRN